MHLSNKLLLLTNQQTNCQLTSYLKRHTPSYSLLLLYKTFKILISIKPIHLNKLNKISIDYVSTYKLRIKYKFKIIDE